MAVVGIVVGQLVLSCSELSWIGHREFYILGNLSVPVKTILLITQRESKDRSKEISYEVMEFTQVRWAGDYNKDDREKGEVKDDF